MDLQQLDLGLLLQMRQDLKSDILLCIPFQPISEEFCLKYGIFKNYICHIVPKLCEMTLYLTNQPVMFTVSQLSITGRSPKYTLQDAVAILPLDWTMKRSRPVEQSRPYHVQHICVQNVIRHYLWLGRLLSAVSQKAVLFCTEPQCWDWFRATAFNTGQDAWHIGRENPSLGGKFARKFFFTHWICAARELISFEINFACALTAKYYCLVL